MKGFVPCEIRSEGVLGIESRLRRECFLRGGASCSLDVLPLVEFSVG